MFSVKQNILLNISPCKNTFKNLLWTDLTWASSTVWPKNKRIEIQHLHSSLVFMWVSYFLLTQKRSFSPLILGERELPSLPPCSAQDMEAGHRQVSQMSLKASRNSVPKEKLKVWNNHGWCRDISLRAWNRDLLGALLSWWRDGSFYSSSRQQRKK